VERREPHGVWGGEIFDQGSVIAVKRPRGRPPKHTGRPSYLADARPGAA
jgi:WhiB family redox-sensing transcriptional regulator